MIFDLRIQLLKFDQIVLHQHSTQSFKVFERLISKVGSLCRVLNQGKARQGIPISIECHPLMASRSSSSAAPLVFPFKERYKQGPCCSGFKVVNAC